MEKTRINQQMEILEQRIMVENNQLKSVNIRYQNQFPLVKESLNTCREIMNGLCSEDVYLRIKSIPEKDLQPHEWVLVQAYEMVYPYQKENKNLKLEVRALREDIRLSSEKHKHLLTELEHYHTLVSEKDSDGRRHQMSHENSRKIMEDELKKAYEDMAAYRKKAADYDNLMKELRKTQDEKEILESKCRLLSPLEDGDIPRFQTNDDLRRKLELLQNDKEYLTKENITMTEKLKRAEEKLERVEEELNENKKNTASYLQQLLDAKHNYGVEYEKKINKEINNLKERHTQELETTKANLIEIYEKQVRFLKEAKEETEIKMDKLTMSLRDKTTQLENLQIEHRNVQRRIDSEISEVRLQLRFKTEELDRVSNSLEEVQANLKAHRMENEMLREKVNVLKSEYYKSEANAKDESSSIRAQLAVAKEQLANYEAIEKEIDQAVIGISETNDRDSNIYLDAINRAPTMSKRRVQQALQLAQRLQIKQRELEAVQEKLREAEKEREVLIEERDMARRVLDKSNQPYSFMVQTIEERERDIVNLKHINRKLDQDYEYLKQDYNALKERFAVSEERLERLMIRRDQIKNIQNILLRFLHSDRENMNFNSSMLAKDLQEALLLDQPANPEQVETRSFKKVTINEAEKGISSFREEKNGSGVQDSTVPMWYQKLKSKK